MKHFLASLLALVLVLTGVLFMCSCDEGAVPPEPSDPNQGQTPDPNPDPKPDEKPADPTVESAMAGLKEFLTNTESLSIFLSFYVESVSVNQGVETVTRTEAVGALTIEQGVSDTGEIRPHKWFAGFIVPEAESDFFAYYVDGTLYFAQSNVDDGALYTFAPEDQAVIDPVYQELAHMVQDLVESLPSLDLDYELVKTEEGKFVLVKNDDSTAAVEALRSFVVDLADMTVADAIATYLLGAPGLDVSGQPALVVEYLAQTTVEDFFSALEEMISMPLDEILPLIEGELGEDGAEVVAYLNELLAMREENGNRTLLSMIAENMGIPEDAQTEETMGIFRDTLESILTEMLVHPIGDIPVKSEYVEDAAGNTTLVTTTYRELIEPITLFTINTSNVAHQIELDEKGTPASGKVEYTLLAGAEMELMPGHTISLEMGVRVGVEWRLEAMDGTEISIPDNAEIQVLDPLFPTN